MADVNTGRRYNNAGRREAAEGTRRRILEAAHQLFVERGYEATTIRAIATAAGVAWQTVYAVFATKAAILSTVFDVAVAGDHEPVAVADREESLKAMREADPRALLAGFTRFAAAAAARTAPLFPVLEQAAAIDADIATLVDKINAQRLHGMTRVATALHERGALRSGVDIEEARDVLWMLAGPGAHRALADRGWTVHRIEAWMTSAILDLLCVESAR